MNPWTAARQASLSINNSQSLLKLMCLKSVMPSNHLSSPSPAFSLSQHHGLFQLVSSSHQGTKVLELSISPSNEYRGLISFRIDWFDLLAVQGTLKSLLQHQGSKASTEKQKQGRLWVACFLCSSYQSFQLESFHPFTMCTALWWVSVLVDSFHDEGRCLEHISIIQGVFQMTEAWALPPGFLTYQIWGGALSIGVFKTLLR